MTGYEPLDLSTEANAGADGFSSSLRPAVGAVTLRGLPFRIGSGSADDPRPYVRFGPGGRGNPLRLAFPRPARTVIVAHLLLGSDIPAGGPIGSAVAEYELGLDRGSPIVVPIRETFEIAALPQLDGPGAEPSAWRVSTASFLALPDRHDPLAPRGAGPWELAGRRMMESEQAAADGFRLWSWRSADGRLATGLTIRPTGVAFIVAGVTVGDLDEDPFVRTGPGPRHDHLLGPTADGESRPLETVVDRGVATFTRRTQPGPPGAFLADPVAGWGQAAVPADRVGQPAVRPTPISRPPRRRPSRSGAATRRSARSAGATSWTVAAPRIPVGSASSGWTGPGMGPHDRGRRCHRPPGAVPGPLPYGVGDPIAAARPPRPRQLRPPTWHIDIGGDMRLGQSHTPTSTAPARAGCRAAM